MGLENVEPARRVEAYILNVEMVLEKLRNSTDPRIRRIAELAAAYVSDARYYLEKGRVFDALACIAYAEGLVDALRHLGLASFEWMPTSRLLERPKVVVAGTFDILHPGHIHLLHQAWLRGRVYVVVARDRNVERFKGRPPIVPEHQRLRVVQAVRYVHRALLGSEEDPLKPLEEIKPDIVLLGPDQWPREDRLAEELAKRGVNARIERLSERLECEYCSATRIACRVLQLSRYLEKACQRST